MAVVTARGIIASMAGILLLAMLPPVPAATDAELKAAREELRLRAKTERRMRDDFEALLARGEMSAAEVADFESYLVKLGLLVDEQRRKVATLEGDTPAPAGAEPLPEGYDRGQTDEERIAMLDAQLGSSLSDFDEKLLKEQKEIAEKSRSATTGDEPGGAAGGEGEMGNRGQGGSGASESDAEGRTGESGQTPPPGAEGAGGESERQAETGESGDPGETGVDGDDQVASAGGPSEGVGQKGETNTPPDIPDGKDDDIVARQLREAAENEQDPELREKLWDEYRRYKASTR